MNDLIFIFCFFTFRFPSPYAQLWHALWFVIFHFHRYGYLMFEQTIKPFISLITNMLGLFRKIVSPNPANSIAPTDDRTPKTRFMPQMRQPIINTTVPRLAELADSIPTTPNLFNYLCRCQGLKRGKDTSIRLLAVALCGCYTDSIMVLQTALADLISAEGVHGLARRLGCQRAVISHWRRGLRTPSAPSAAAVEMAWLILCRPDLIPDWMQRTSGPGPGASVAARAKEAAYDRRRKEQRKAKTPQPAAYGAKSKPA